LTTKRGTLLKNQIPIRTHFSDESLQGFDEADTVAHCGNSLAGNFAWSLIMTDIVTGWIEGRATWNKGSAGVLEQIQDIEAHLPFSLRGFDCDNGSGFLNHHLVRYFTDHPNRPAMTRSRPYRKKTTTPRLSKRTGLIHGSCSATTALIGRASFPS